MDEDLDNDSDEDLGKSVAGTVGVCALTAGGIATRLALSENRMTSASFLCAQSINSRARRQETPCVCSWLAVQSMATVIGTDFTSLSLVLSSCGLKPSLLIASQAALTWPLMRPLRSFTADL